MCLCSDSPQPAKSISVCTGCSKDCSTKQPYISLLGLMRRLPGRLVWLFDCINVLQIEVDSYWWSSLSWFVRALFQAFPGSPCCTVKKLPRRKEKRWLLCVFSRCGILPLGWVMSRGTVD